MKRISFILILVITWAVCGSRTCTEENNAAEQRKEKLLESAMDSIRNEAENSNPDTDQLIAFGESARQKLADFGDYVKIASDTTLEQTFRKQAAAMAEKLFISDRTNISGWVKPYHSDSLNTLRSLLDNGLQKGFDIWVKPENTVISEPLKPMNDSLYSGKISFIRKVCFMDERKPQQNLPDILEINIFAVRRIKVFGSEKLNVWNVFLGDIKH